MRRIDPLSKPLGSDGYKREEIGAVASPLLKKKLKIKSLLKKIIFEKGEIKFKNLTTILKNVYSILADQIKV